MDILIKNARTIDGSGALAYCGDVGIKEGKMIRKDLAEQADKVIDAAGKYVAPGFVDSHSRGDAILGLDFGGLSKIN